MLTRYANTRGNSCKPVSVNHVTTEAMAPQIRDSERAEMLLNYANGGLALTAQLDRVTLAATFAEPRLEPVEDLNAEPL